MSSLHDCGMFSGTDIARYARGEESRQELR